MMYRDNRHESVLSVKELSRSFWDGKRWVASALKGNRLVEQLFTEYGSADSWCAEMKAFSPCITCLSSLLKSVNGSGFAPVTGNALQEMEDELSYYPLRSATNELSLFDQLSTGEFIPALWSFNIHPLTSIVEYYVFTDLLPKDINECKKRPYAIHCSFASAMETFNFLTRKFQDTAKDITLAGVINTIRYKGIKVLYSSSHGVIKIEHDITDPFSFTIPVFARYHSARKKLLFFDGNLRRSLLQKLNEVYDFKYFNFDIFSPGQSINSVV